MTQPILPANEETRFRESQVTLLGYWEMMERQVRLLPTDLSNEELRATHRAFPDARMRDRIIEARRAARARAVEHFPQIARQSLIVTVTSAIEEQAHLFCDALHAHRALPIRWKDLRGNTLERLHTYAFRLASLPAVPATAWQDAQRLHQIRDCIVHANGEVARSNDAKRLRQIQHKVPGYDIDDQGYVSLQENAGKFAIDVFSMLFNHLYFHGGLPPVIAGP